MEVTFILPACCRIVAREKLDVLYTWAWETEDDYKLANSVCQEYV